tara:strand:- start:257 stop:1243 length:987 start_codon:yes stop_codon:yes gene_type:complete
MQLAATLADNTTAPPTLYTQGEYWYGRFKPECTTRPRRKCLGNVAKTTERQATAKLLAWVAELELAETDPPTPMLMLVQLAPDRLHKTAKRFMITLDEAMIGDIRKVTSWEVNQFIGHQRSAGKAENTLRKYARELKQLFKVAVEDDLIDKNPVTSAFKTTHKRTEPKPVNIDPAYFEAVLEQLPTVPWRAAVASCYYLGLRRREVFDAKLPFLDRDRMSLDVWGKKTNRMRVTRVEPEFLPFLYGYPPQQVKREWLTMPPTAYDMGHHVLRAACDRVSPRQRFTWQDMRRNRATLWRKAGHPASAVNQWLGHSEQTATDHYVGNMGT